MIHLKRVRLENFQSHRNSVIDFDRGLNVIVGPSDSGKSAIIRAIKWALYNEPSGNYFIREGETEVSVTLEFSNNIKVKRLRNKSKNMYILYNNNGDEIIFEGFGNKVPQEIIDLLGIKKISLDTNESDAINLGEQLDGAFLLSEKASTRASAIGRLIGVNLIDDALKETLKDVRNISIEKNIIDEKVKKIEKELLTYSYLESLKKDILKLEDMEKKIKQKTNIKNKLIKNLEIYINIEKTNENLKIVLNELDGLDKLEENIYRLEYKSKNLIFFRNINNNLYKNRKQIIDNNNLLSELVDITRVEDIVVVIDSLKNKLKKLKKLKARIDRSTLEIQNISSINKNLKDIKLIEEKTDQIQVKIDELNKLITFQKKLNSVNKSLSIGNSYIKELKYLEEIKVLFKKLSNNIAKKNLMVSLSTQIYNCKSMIEAENKFLKNANREIEDNLKLYKSLLSKNDKCPFCLSDITEDGIEHIIKHYN